MSPLLVDLTDQQRAAVTHTGGPLIVLAGPGTGKTRVITTRIAYQILELGSDPESVLAVTYTTKAAAELRERLGHHLGHAAQRVRASTIHGFGWRLVRRFTDLLGLPAEPKLIDSAVARRLMRRLVREHNLFAEWTAQGRDTVLGSAAKQIKLLSDWAITPDRAAELARQWAQRLDAGRLDPGQPGADADDAPPEDRLAAQRHEQRRFAQTAELYRLFHDRCARLGWLTFDDLLIRPIALLRAHAGAAAIVRDECRRVLVDEFQDANAACLELMRLVAPPGLRRRAAGGERMGPDITVVGDDDQSIYGFRGADERAFDRFARLWTDATAVKLTINHRSERVIVQTAQAIIERQEHRFAKDKVLSVPDAKLAAPPAQGAGVEAVTVDDNAFTGEVIAAAIHADRAANPTRPFAAYAVIARSHTDLDRVADGLEREGIPVSRLRPRSPLDDRAVQDLIAWAEALAHRSRHALARLLMRPPASIPTADVLRWNERYETALGRLRTIEAIPEAPRVKRPERGPGEPEPGSAPHFLAWLLDHAHAEPRHAPALDRFARLHDELDRLAAGQPADAAIAQIMLHAGLAHHELLAGEPRARRVADLAAVLRFVRERADALDEPRDLAALLDYIDDLEESERRMTARTEDAVDGTPDEAEPRPDAVTLITAHAAKGLEFDTVFVSQCRSPHGFPSADRDDAPGLPAWMTDPDATAPEPSDRRLGEERRLFFVACTRAQRRLVLLARGRKGDKRGSGACDFFDELVFDEPAKSWVTRRTQADVLKQAGRAATRLAAADDALDAAAGAAAPDRRATILARVRREVRQEAAAALDAADDPALSPEALAAIHARLAGAAERLAIAARLARDPAAKAPDAPTLREFHDRVRGALHTGVDPRDLVPRRPRLPLRLSPDDLRSYGACPRCFYLHRVVGWPEPAGPPSLVGHLVHHALHAFFELARDRQNLGEPAPTLGDLRALARAAFDDRWPEGRRPDAEQLAKITAQLELALTKLHRDEDEIELLDRPVTLRLRRAEHEHALVVRLDRVDRLPGPGAGHRVIDYKTGGASKILLEPKPDDLHVGLCALALRAHQGVPDDDTETPAVGVFEYWCVAEGTRGRIDLATLKYAKLRAKLDDALDAIAAGRFERAKGCKDGPCRVLDEF